MMDQLDEVGGECAVWTEIWLSFKFESNPSVRVSLKTGKRESFVLAPTLNS